jgi:adhesin transport system membrane fusion protein
MTDAPPLFARSIVAVVLLLIVSFVAWAAIAKVDEIARGDGKVIPVSKTQVIQATEPGVVQEIAIQVGQVVRKGQLLMRLDDTTTTSSLGESEAKARALKAKIVRLAIEEGGDFSVPFACPPDIAKTAPQICDNEIRLLEARRTNFENKASVLKERLVQRVKELDESHSNIARLTEVVAVTQREKDLIGPMVAKRLVAQTDLLRVDRELTEQQGQIALAREGIDRLTAAINEARLQVTELELQMRQEALAEKTQALAELSVVDETIRGATDRVARTDIRSPVDGVVNTLDINTLGSYVQAGTVVAGVVPTSDTLLVEARISPRDVAFVRRGQRAVVKVTAYDFSIYGGLEGEVSNVSADSLVDQDTGETFYQVYVATPRTELEKDGRKYAIMPGMVTSVEIITGEKTILNYLLKPVHKARTEALTER